MAPNVQRLSDNEIREEAMRRAEAHGLHYTEPVLTWDDGMPLGNGILGALVWGNGQPLKISLDRTDLWDLRPVPEFHAPEYTYATVRQWHQAGRHGDLVRLLEAPYGRGAAPTKIPAGRIELDLGSGAAFAAADLDLQRALVTVRWHGEMCAQFCLHATEPVGLIRITPPAAVSACLIAPPYAGPGKAAGSEGELAQLGYPASLETSEEGWCAFTQQGYAEFGFAIYLAWREEKEAWQGAWSVASTFESAHPLETARERVQSALEAGWEAMLAAHEAWWQDYWQKASVSLPNVAVERLWFLEQYKFGSASRRGHPPITLQGPWTADDGKLPPWKGDYHHDLNTQLSYWPCYSGNHLDEGLAFLDWLWETRDNCREWTHRFFGLPGLNVPMTADLNNHQIGGWRQYTHSATTSAWLSHHFYLHWRYSGDRDFLRERAYPYLRETAVFLEAVTAERDGAGRRTLPLSASPEIHDNRPEAWFPTMTNYDLALLRWLFQTAAELADELNLAEEAARWRQVGRELPEFAMGEDGRLLIAEGQPLMESHRHFSHLMAIHPLGLIGWEDGVQAQRTIRAALEELDRLGTDYWCGYSFAWLANLAARARDGERAERALEIFAEAFTLRNSFHCNGDQSGKGYSRFTYRPFTLEGNFAAAAGIQEMLLQSQRGIIRIFPAIPDTWQDVSFTTLRAEGAFLISARRSQGTTERVEILAEQAGTCRLISPFRGEEIALPLQQGEQVILTARSPLSGEAGEIAPTSN